MQVKEGSLWKWVGVRDDVGGKATYKTPSQSDMLQTACSASAKKLCWQAEVSCCHLLKNEVKGAKGAPTKVQ